MKKILTYFLAFAFLFISCEKNTTPGQNPEQTPDEEAGQEPDQEEDQEEETFEIGQFMGSQWISEETQDYKGISCYELLDAGKALITAFSSLYLVAEDTADGKYKEGDLLNIVYGGSSTYTVYMNMETLLSYEYNEEASTGVIGLSNNIGDYETRIFFYDENTFSRTYPDSDGNWIPEELTFTRVSSEDEYDLSVAFNPWHNDYEPSDLQSFDVSVKWLEDYPYQFASWGAVSAYYAPFQVWSGINDFTSWMNDGEFIKYNSIDEMIQLELCDDPAADFYGGGLRLPTKGEVQELIDACEIIYHEMDGIMDAEFVLKTDETVSICLEGQGYYESYGGELKSGGLPFYWTSTVDETNMNNAIALTFEQDADGHFQPVFKSMPRMNVLSLVAVYPN